MRAFLLLLALPLAALPACGGKVVLDTAAATSTGGASTTSASSPGSGGASSCSQPCPEAGVGGEPCPCEGQTCSYNPCTAGGPLTTNLCTEGVWSTSVNTCGPVPCGAEACAPDEVCLRMQPGKGEDTFTCIASPCGSSFLSCACAASACNGTPCVSAAGSLLVCGCNPCD
jgi:hypothetical protein